MTLENIGVIYSRARGTFKGQGLLAIFSLLVSVYRDQALIRYRSEEGWCSDSVFYSRTFSRTSFSLLKLCSFICNIGWGRRTSPPCFDPVEQRVQWDKECSTYVNGYIIQMVLGPPSKQVKMRYFQALFLNVLRPGKSARDGQRSLGSLESQDLPLGGPSEEC